jgi:F420-dependent oxidoreductase-like protein
MKDRSEGKFNPMNKHPIRFGIQTAQQHVEWERMPRFWTLADDWGYDSLWVFDHFYPIFVPDPHGPCFEGWTVLSALSQHTKRARLGSLVNGNTYRNPCLLAKMAATLDHLCGGRFVLGIGAGWFELEHNSFGIDFKNIPGRLRALDEALQIIKGMFTQEKTTLHGRHYDVVDAVCNPRPVQRPHPPIMIGGRGENQLLKIVARHADMWNTFGDPDGMRRMVNIIERHGDTVGRDTDEIDKTVGLQLCYRGGKEREEKTLATAAAHAQTTIEQARDCAMIGERQECIDKIERYVKAGITHFIFVQRWESLVADDYQAFAEEVIPSFRTH